MLQRRISVLHQMGTLNPKYVILLYQLFDSSSIRKLLEDSFAYNLLNSSEGERAIIYEINSDELVRNGRRKQYFQEKVVLEK